VTASDFIAVRLLTCIDFKLGFNIVISFCIFNAVLIITSIPVTVPTMQCSVSLHPWNQCSDLGLNCVERVTSKAMSDDDGIIGVGDELKHPVAFVEEEYDVVFHSPEAFASLGLVFDK
jgi:hypothetical protein